MLQEAIGKSTGRRAHIQTSLPGDINLPVLQSALQFQSTATDIFQVFGEQTNRAACGDLHAGLLNLLFVDQDLAGKDERLRAFARGGQTALNQNFVESFFQNEFSQ